MRSRLARWCLVLFGGIFVGAGLVLHGQIAMARYMREETQSTFFLWRAVGEATFFLQDEVTRLALRMDDVPESVLVDSNRIAWALTGFGLLMVCAAPLVRRGRSRTTRRVAK